MPRISRIRKAATIASTFAIALGIGFAMQYGDANAARFASDEPGVVRKPVLIIDYSPLREMTDFRLKPEPPLDGRITNLSIDPDSVKLVALVEDIAVEDGSTLFSQAQPRTTERSDCDVMAVTAPNDVGAVTMSIASDCRVNMPFSVNHGGMTFSAQTNDEGSAILTIPAMSVDAAFFVTFDDGKNFATSTYVPNAENYNRVVFQWEGHPGTYVQAAEQLNIAARVDRLGVDVGEIPRFAEVYSFAADVALPDGLEGIDIVATVTEQNCGLDLIAESFTIFPGIVDLMFKDIRITLPGCDHLGDTIALKKILGEQTLAAK